MKAPLSRWHRVGSRCVREACRFFLHALLTFVSFLTAWPVFGARWPAVKPETRTFPINLASGAVTVDLPILSKDNSVLYRLFCLGGSQDFLDERGTHDKVNWVGPFMCVLNAANRPVSENSLLAEDGAPPWFTRGQFHGEDLVGACGDYPEFGLNRSFRLRGFVLRLRVRDLELDASGALTRFALVVSAAPDSSARRPAAERPNYVRPRSGKCDIVRKGRDPRYCRIPSGPKTGSWALCPKE